MGLSRTGVCSCDRCAYPHDLCGVHDGLRRHCAGEEGLQRRPAGIVQDLQARSGRFLGRGLRRPPRRAPCRAGPARCGAQRCGRRRTPRPRPTAAQLLGRCPVDAGTGRSTIPGVRAHQVGHPEPQHQRCSDVAKHRPRRHRGMPPAHCALHLCRRASTQVRPYPHFGQQNPSGNRDAARQSRRAQALRYCWRAGQTYAHREARARGPH